MWSTKKKYTMGMGVVAQNMIVVLTQGPDLNPQHLHVFD